MDKLIMIVILCVGIALVAMKMILDFYIEDRVKPFLKGDSWLEIIWLIALQIQAVGGRSRRKVDAIVASIDAENGMEVMEEYVISFYTDRIFLIGIEVEAEDRVAKRLEWADGEWLYELHVQQMKVEWYFEWEEPNEDGLERSFELEKTD